MCNFFSFCSDGQGSFYFFDVTSRYVDANPVKFDFDSHTSIAKLFNKNEDKLNKYEFDPFTSKFRVDQINAKHDDSEAAEKWVRGLDFWQVDPIKAKLGFPKGVTNFANSLYLRGTGITSLPDNLTVGGFLDLRGTGITSLPDNLTVGGFLDLRGTGITKKSVPRRLKNKCTW